MRGLKKSISLVTAAALFLTALPTGGGGLAEVQAAGKAASADVSVKLNPSDASPFNDTDGDGFGEFEGWGTSLCWWANRLGYDETLTQEAARVFFSDEGLDMNIGRYNVGGGDHVFELGVEEYGLEGSRAPSYSGTNMKVESQTALKDKKYTASDADLGISSGGTVGEFKKIGWINKLGDSPGSGDNLKYTVKVDKAGEYTVKLLLCHNANTDRDVAVKVGEQEYVANNEQVKAGQIVAASGGDQTLFLVTFPSVALNAGDNQVIVAGKNNWTLDFVKMVVRPKENGLPEGDKYAHYSHIQRSDSVVPGYCVDVTEIDVSTHDLAYYEEKFTRVDIDSGYAWNYDWDADANQMNILKAAMAASGEDFIAEAFSNSPPYFMTYSGCSSGNTDSSKNNLRSDCYEAFASYMADVIVHWAKEGVVNFQSATPMNEPATSYWGANSNKQEGCHFDPGASQSKIIVLMKQELDRQAAEMEEGAAKTTIENMIYSGSDETSIDDAITSYNAMTTEAKNAISRIDTHTYGGSKRTELSKLAQKAGKNLWMSEVDGAYTAGSGAGEMTAALGLAERIMKDLNGMRCSAWILWNAVDMNVDAENKWDKDDLNALGWDSKVNSGYWGIAIGDHNNKEIVLTKKYDAFGQFSRYIRPGYSLIATDNANTLAAYDPKGKKVVVVAMNKTGNDQTWKFDLGAFETMGEDIEAYRTCVGERWEDVSMATVNPNADNSFTANLAANSIVTYVIPDVKFDKEKADEEAEEDAANKAEQEAEEAAEEKLQQEIAESMEADLEEIALTSDMVTGSDPWNNDQTNGVQNVVDGDYGTFFDGVGNGYVQIDLGSQKTIAAVGYAPRSGYTDRCVDASFYGSNDGSAWEKLYTITETPTAGSITRAYAMQFENTTPTYQYIKYAVPEGEGYNCNIAEIKLYKLKEGASLPEFPDTLEKLIAYCEKQTQGKNYSEASKQRYDTAMAEAKKAVADNADDTAKTAARKKLLLAYQSLSIFNTSFTGVNGDVMYDTNGKVIQAHGGQIQQLEVNGKKKWYWIGEDKTNDYRPCPGIHMYSSDDLYNWDDEGVVLKTAKTYEEFLTDEYFTNLYSDLTTEEEKKRVFTDIWQGESSDEGCVIERPKMLYNDKTGKYVIWFHADGQDPFGSGGGNYAKAKAGVAISDSPTGPYKLLGSYLLNYDPDASHGFDGDVGGHVRDMNLFKDDDGTGYVMYSSDGNETMHIAKLNDEFTNVAQPDNSQAVQGVDFTRNFVGESREAPAMFKYKDKYYLVTSGCTGWNPNPARYAVADHPLGPWTMVGDPCTDEESNTTYHTQSTCVFPVDAEAGKFIYMGDRWKNSEVPENGPGTLKDSRYVWLPVEFIGDGQIALRRYSDWTLEDLEGKGMMEIITELPDTIGTIGETITALPDVIEVKTPDGGTKKVDVEWTIPTSLSWNTIGPVTIEGVIKNGEQEQKIQHTVSVVNENTVYFFDSTAEESAYLETVKAKLGDKLRNKAPDQAYTTENHAGFAGVMDVDVGTKSAGSGIYDRGYYAKGNKNIDYAFDLEAGSYTVITGYQEWWNTARATKVSVLSTGEQEEELASTEFTLAKTDTSRQESVKFRLKEAGKVIVRVSKTGSPDPVLSWIAMLQNGKSGDDLANKEALNKVLEDVKALDKGIYTSASWKEFQNFYKGIEQDALALKEDPGATQGEVDTIVAQIEQAMKLLVKNKTVLENGIEDNQVPEKDKSSYTDASWKVYADALKQAQDLLKKDRILEKDVKQALKALSDSKDSLELKKEKVKDPSKPDDSKPVPDKPVNGKANQTISYTKNVKKAYGAKPFMLNVKLTKGNGTLTYVSSDKKVATVSKAGKVTIKDTGLCTITVTASATSSYNKKTVKITLKVAPKKASLISVKAVKGKKMQVKWKKDSRTSGYVVEYCLNKKFKSGVKRYRVMNQKATSTTIKGLKKGKKYYVRVRYYKVVHQKDGTFMIPGEWSNVKASGKIK